MKISEEEKLFELISELGEMLEGDLHIIDMSDEYPITEGDKKFRVYHKQGFCFDLEKIFVEDEMVEGKDGFEYSFYSEWDGFDPCTVEKAIEVLEYFQMIKSQDWG